MILGIDPGREKCGLAVVTVNLEIVDKDIISTSSLKAGVEALQKKYGIKQLVLGEGTNSKFIRQEVGPLFKKVKLVDETNSTLEARDYYWQQNPPRGWKRFLPRSLLFPPEPIDDYAAVILVKRYLTSPES